jgi:hypothetical protein
MLTGNCMLTGKRRQERIGSDFTACPGETPPRGQRARLGGGVRGPGENPAPHELDRLKFHAGAGSGRNTSDKVVLSPKPDQQGRYHPAFQTEFARRTSLVRRYVCGESRVGWVTLGAVLFSRRCPGDTLSDG